MLITFFMNGTILAFFHSKGNLPVRKQVLKIMFRGLQIESPHIFNIWILISSWALFGSRLLIIRRMSSFAKWQVDNVLSVRNGNSEGKTLPFEIGEHWSAKKEFKISLFPWKSTIYIYHDEIEEECRKVSFHLTVFARVTSSAYCQYLDHPDFEQFF